MAQFTGSNQPPSIQPNALVAGIAFSTSLLGAVIAGAGHPVAGLGVLSVTLLGALGIHHILWLAEEGAAAMDRRPEVVPQATKPRRVKVYPQNPG